MSKNFIDVPEVYQIHVYDYLSGKNYVYYDVFNCYSQAVEFIKHYDFEADFLKNPISIDIVTVPKFTFDNIDFLGVSNASKPE